MQYARVVASLNLLDRHVKSNVLRIVLEQMFTPDAQTKQEAAFVVAVQDLQESVAW
ncbi:hypothetical protein DPMN_071283 [Dreissena polymorpha]|uniref:Uncharacterized protein n=1 Tax=Dreissena polymorpha TaxID=45954 RepID=A0A9D3Z769_DREPO|nr:hypothetical protein DPMN_071283 [Dreissena polymorpha]